VRRFKRWASAKFPLSIPVKIYLRPKARMPDAFGYFNLSEEETSGTIWIREDANFDTLLATLCEEWAHARTYTLDDYGLDDPHHHPAFWAEYGRIELARREREW
jgi:hypothetical protein